jgi:hypothetical protein
LLLVLVVAVMLALTADSFYTFQIFCASFALAITAMSLSGEIPLWDNSSWRRWVEIALNVNVLICDLRLTIKLPYSEGYHDHFITN